VALDRPIGEKREDNKEKILWKRKKQINVAKGVTSIRKLRIIAI
jgi:hypothetical protein